MWANLEEEILVKARVLRDNGYINTSKWCEHICKNLSQYVKVTQLFDKDVLDLFLAFEHEFLSRTDFGSRELRERYIRIVQISLENAIRNSPNPKQMFHEIIPLLYQMNNTGRATNKIVEIFSKMDESLIEVRIYGSLFVFMLHLEGEYFPIIRTLYALNLAGKGSNVDFKILKKKSLGCMKKELGDFGKPLFNAYDDVGKNMRNAIAHANFKFEKGKLICWNLDPTTKVETWRREFTYNDLSTALVDIYSISHVYMYWYILRELVDKVTHYIRQHAS
jgi:hypothetical protein